jgi:hypothetical protein
MRTRFLTGLAGLCLLLSAAAPARAADDKPTAPTFFVRTKSIENLVADAKYLAEVADKADDFKMWEGVYKSMLKGNSLEGVDITKPIGAYGFLGANIIDSTVVVLLPVADEKALLDFLATKDIKPEKDKDGVYSVMVPNVPETVYFRFANKYAYVTLKDKENIAPKALLEPGKVLPNNPTSVLSMTVDIDKIPAELKKVMIGQSANQIAGLKDKKQEGETDAQHRLRIAMADEAADFVKTLVNDGGELTLSWDVDRAKGDLSMSLSLTGKPDTKLSKHFADLGAAKSVGAGLIGKDSALNGLVHLSLPERVRKAMEPAIDEGFKKALENEKDKDKRDAAEKFFRAIAPSLKSGEYDLGVDLRGPSAKGQYTLVGALKIQDGAAIDKTFKDIVKTLPEQDKKGLQLDAARAGGVSIHKIDGGQLPPNFKEVFGDGPVFFALRDDALMVALGDGALEALKDALAGKPGPSQPLRLEASVDRVWKVLPKDQQKLVEEASKKAFAQKPGADKVTVVLEGGRSLKLSFKAKAGVVAFFAYLAEHQNQSE